MASISDTYGSFPELAAHEKEGVDFAVEVAKRDSPISVIAIHGGNIEPATTEIARAIAGDTFSCYSFVGNGSVEACEKLHITSANFDEPRCLELVNETIKTVSIHGMAENAEFVMIGGLDAELIRTIERALDAGGFVTRMAPEHVNGDSPENICNRCRSRAGVQIEIGRGYRERFLADGAMLDRFSGIVRGAIESFQPSTIHAMISA